jgi:hypothetical protein
VTHGISSGSTSAMMLIESVLAFEVGAAASSILSKAIMYCGRLGNIAWYKTSVEVNSISPSEVDRGLRAISSSFCICSSAKEV